MHRIPLNKGSGPSRQLVSGGFATLRAASLVWWLLGAAAKSLLAQNYAVNWHVIAAGGGISTNSSYAISGTIGQPGTDRLVGDRFEVDGGFWSFAVVGNPVAPILSIERTSTNTLVLRWASPSTGYVVQSSTTLEAADWTSIPAQPSDNGLQRTLVVIEAYGSQFYRLIRP